MINRVDCCPSRDWVGERGCEQGRMTQGTTSDMSLLSSLYLCNTYTTCRKLSDSLKILWNTVGSVSGAQVSWHYLDNLMQQNNIFFPHPELH